MRNRLFDKTITSFELYNVGLEQNDVELMGVIEQCQFLTDRH